MSIPSHKLWAGRLFAEFLIVFLSIILAFIAEDWRQSRNDKAEETRVLRLMLRDLQDDQDDLQTFRDRLLIFEAAGVDAFDLLNSRNVHPDTLAVVLRRATGGYSYRPSFPAYAGMVQSSRLGLIQDDELRDMIITYHDETVG